MPGNTNTAPEWRDVPGLDGVQASSEGGVRRGKRLLPVWAGHGGYRVCQPVEGERNTFRVGLLVCLAFHGRPARGHVVGHTNGDRQDDTPTNLSWVPCRERSQA